MLGIIIFASGIWRRALFALELRRTRAMMTQEGLIHGQSAYPISVALVVSALLLPIGQGAILGIAFR